MGVEEGHDEDVPVEADQVPDEDVQSKERGPRGYYTILDPRQS